MLSLTKNIVLGAIACYVTVYSAGGLFFIILPILFVSIIIAAPLLFFLQKKGTYFEKVNRSIDIAVWTTQVIYLAGYFFRTIELMI